MLRVHRKVLLNWFQAKKTIFSGVVEGLNGRLKLTFRKSYGFRPCRVAEIALYHILGALPEQDADPRILLRNVAFLSLTRMDYELSNSNAGT